jgi:iron uptake system component EfeO
MIDACFGAAQQSLAPYRSGTGYVPYNRLTEADTRKLAQAIDTLAELLSQISGKLVEALRRGAPQTAQGAARQ